MSDAECNIDGSEYDYESLNALLSEENSVMISIENARAYIQRTVSSILVKIYSADEHFTHFTIEKSGIPNQGERKLYSWEGGTGKPGTMWYKKPRDTFSTWLARLQGGTKEAWMPSEEKGDESEWEYHS